MAHNVIGSELQPCSYEPLTGFYRNGCCDTGAEDIGLHLVCVETTAEFLQFSKDHGNDLSTPVPEYGFSGLQPGDRWCVCVSRWVEAAAAGKAAPVILEATHAATLEFVSLSELSAHAFEQ